MIYPGALNEAVAQWLAANAAGGLAGKTADLSASYRKGDTSSHVDVAAYLVARVPATYATNVKVQQALAEVMPAFEPQSLLDIGTGPGTASWAALAQWPTIARVTQCEQDKTFAGLAAALNTASGLEPLRNAKMVLKSEVTLDVDLRADLVVASYMLAELPLEDMAKLAARLWARTERVLLLLEPGTPQGFARLRKVREVLLGQGALVIAPCTHQLPCPMTGTDWCHFKTRVQRSREHMHAKQATVPFEDEAFSYLVLAKAPLSPSGSSPNGLGERGFPFPNLLGKVPKGDGGRRAEGGRVIAPVSINKVAATLRLCTEGMVKETTVASRDKPAYKRAKKAQWGDVWE